MIATEFGSWRYDTSEALYALKLEAQGMKGGSWDPTSHRWKFEHLDDGLGGMRSMPSRLPFGSLPSLPDVPA